MCGMRVFFYILLIILYLERSLYLFFLPRFYNFFPTLCVCRIAVNVLGYSSVLSRFGAFSCIPDKGLSRVPQWPLPRHIAKSNDFSGFLLS